MKIIALIGAQNTGKTHTLLSLITLIKEDGGREIEPDLLLGWEALLEYKGKRIGITTRGGDALIQEFNCEFFRRYQCDVMITAARTRTGGIDHLYSLAEDLSASLIWATKSYYATNISVKPDQSQFDRMNNLEAQFLFNMID